MADTKQQLVKAFDLIKKDQTEEAVALLKPIVAAEPDNADAWWLMANAAGEPKDARRALVNVLKINSGHVKARDLLDKLNEQFPPSDDELMMMLDIEDSAPPPYPMATEGGFDDADASQDDSIFSSDIDDLFKEEVEPLPTAEEANRTALRMGQDDDDFGLKPGENPFAELLERDERAHRRGGGGNRRRILLPLVAILALVLVGGLLFMLLRGGDEGGEPTVTVSDPGLLSSVDATAINPDNATILEAARSNAENTARQSIAPDAKAIFAEIEGGYALVVQVCSQPGPTLPQIATDGIRIAALQAGSSPAISGLLSHVGVSVEDCLRDNDTLYRATAPIQAAIDFSATGGNTPQALNTFRQSWVVQS